MCTWSVRGPSHGFVRVTIIRLTFRLFIFVYISKAPRMSPSVPFVFFPFGHPFYHFTIILFHFSVYSPITYVK